MINCPYYQLFPCWHLLREIHPVGQGAFYTEMFSEAYFEPYKVVAYDCGGIQQYVQRSKPVDVLFVSHFHEDHINGVKYLIEKNQDIEIYIPKVSPQTLLLDFVYNLDKTNGNSLANEFILNWVIPAFTFNSEKADYSQEGVTVHIVSNDTAVSILDNKNKPIWEYNLFWENGDERIDKNILTDICSILNISGKPIYDKNFFANVANIFTNASIKKQIKSMYANHSKKGHNAYSMLVYSHPVGTTHLLDCCKRNATCLYTGDASVPGRVLSVASRLDIDNIQVPHHGSRHNFSDKLYYRGLNAFISFGEKNQYHHPGKYELCQIANSCDSIHLVTEDQKTLWCEEVPFVI